MSPLSDPRGDRAAFLPAARTRVGVLQTAPRGAAVSPIPAPSSWAGSLLAPRLRGPSSRRPRGGWCRTVTERDRSPGRFGGGVTSPAPPSDVRLPYPGRPRGRRGWPAAAHSLRSAAAVSRRVARRAGRSLASVPAASKGTNQIRAEIHCKGVRRGGAFLSDRAVPVSAPDVSRPAVVVRATRVPLGGRLSRFRTAVRRQARRPAHESGRYPGQESGGQHQGSFLARPPVRTRPVHPLARGRRGAVYVPERRRSRWRAEEPCSASCGEHPRR